MQTGCPSCNRIITVDDAKVPAGPFRVKCPGCGTAVTLTAAPSGGSGEMKHSH